MNYEKKIPEKLVNEALEAIQNNNFKKLELSVSEMMDKYKDSAIAHLFNAKLYEKKGNHKEVIKAFEKCLDISPNYGEAHRQFSEYLRTTNKIKKSLDHAKKAQELNQNYVASYDTLGNALMANNNVKDAIDVYKKGLEINSDVVELNNNLGNAYRRNGDYKDSIHCFEKCLNLDPNKAIYFTNLALTYFEIEEYMKALSLSAKANDLEKENPHVFTVTAHILTKLYKFIDAEKSYEHAIKLKKDYGMAYNGLANVQKLLGKLDESYNSLQQAFKYSTIIEQDYSNLLMVKNYLLKNSYKESLSEAKKFEVLNFNKDEINTAFKNHKSKKRKLKLGFVSGDFYEHPVSYFMTNVLSNFNKEKFILYGYYNNYVQDEQTKLISSKFDFFKNFNDLSTDQKFDKIRNDEIDILFDLSGHTARNSLAVFRKKPSPIQISWLGYCFTTGLSSMDYILCDEIVLPKDDEKWFVEKPMKMSNSYYSFSIPRYGLTNIEEKKTNSKTFVYGCFSNAPKITKDVVKAWGTILKKTENSILYLKAKTYSDPQGQQWIMDLFESNGIDKSRIIFEGNSLREDYLKTYNNIDIILDTFPYPGGTTTCEALMMGVPVISLKGKNFLSRNGVTILENVELKEFIANNVENYIDIAISYAKKNKKSSLKDKIKIRKKFLNSSIMDGKGFCDELEIKLNDVWDEWLKGN